MNLYNLGKYTVCRATEKAVKSDRYFIPVVMPTCVNSVRVTTHIQRIARHHITGLSDKNVNQFHWYQNELKMYYHESSKI